MPSGGTLTWCCTLPCGARHIWNAWRRVSKSSSKLGSSLTVSMSQASNCSSLAVSSSARGESLGRLPSTSSITTLARWCRVPISIPSRSTLRERISCAAFLVNVTNAIHRGGQYRFARHLSPSRPSCASCRFPAPATTSVRSSWITTALRCSLFSPASAGSLTRFSRRRRLAALRFASLAARRARYKRRALSG